ASNQVSATVTSSGLVCLTTLRHSRQKSSGTHGATSMRQPDAPASSQVRVTESGAPYANARYDGSALFSSGRSATPAQPLNCLSGSVWVASNVYQVVYGDAGFILPPLNAPLPPRVP